MDESLEKVDSRDVMPGIHDCSNAAGSGPWMIATAAPPKAFSVLHRPQYMWLSVASLTGPEYIRRDVVKSLDGHSGARTRFCEISRPQYPVLLDATLSQGM